MTSFKLPFISFALAAGAHLFGADVQPITSFQAPYETLGSVESYAPEFDELIAADAKLEILAKGFRWSEGPVWDSEQDRLIFTDVPKNTAYTWTEGDGVSIFLQPSGHAKMQVEGSPSPGANGLVFTPDHQLVLCQHGNRQVALYDDATQTITTLTDRYGDREFNSPNDLVFASNGDLFFTDPPYGRSLEEKKKINTHYVYRLSAEGEVSQITDSIFYPNGIGLSPDNATLYIASSAPGSAAVYSFDLDKEGNAIGEAKTLLDGTAYQSDTRKGSCDGMAIDERGNIWTSGPGGVYVIAPNGTLLGFINTQGGLANCTFGGPNGTTLYLTAANKLMRIETKVTGL